MADIYKKHQIVVKNGRPTAVVLGIKEYENLLEIAEEKEDLAELRRIKKQKTSFREIGDYLKK